MKEEIKEEVKVVNPVPTVSKTGEIPAWRKIVILTDGNNIKIQEANVAGNLELMAILQSLIGHLAEKK